MNIRIDVYHHLEAGGATSQLDLILARLETVMGKIDDLNTVLDEVKAAQADQATALANIANDLDTLIAQAQGGVTPADADAFLASLTGVRDTARAAADAAKAAADKFVSPNETP